MDLILLKPKNTYIFQVYNLYLEDNHSEEVIHVTQMVAYTEDTVHSLSLNPILIV